ncbi:cytochrome b/b6 domain-containing protein [Streptomyces sp. RM72]|uniref:cytochrome b/b6 domain-containing protein n=1 Tax=Streptomyces sp. RM72 TaxID=1115510 RepID=UPI001B369F81|nr:cytochrome b/b6 domain-containing protein [Streptomyces sp. RM72]MBQ0887129.1 cytochrome b/b6 domain-containing protein [Streptomyces sp. RM72]
MRWTAGSMMRTGAAMPPEPDDRVRRFGYVQRMIHRTTAWLMLTCLATAACLYLGPLAQVVGRRHLVAAVHEWSGVCLPLPTLLGLFHPSFRADLRRLNRFAVYDRQWLRAVRKRRTSPQDRPAGKFNAGQKIFAGWIAGAVVIMMFTGLLMWFAGLLPFISRTSAIFVHDLLAWLTAAVIIGHMRKAYQDPEARLGMRSGYVSVAWARRHHSRWQPVREDRSHREADDRKNSQGTQA